MPPTDVLKLDTGNTGFMILAASLVMLMTPGLAFFYGGLGRPEERAGHHDPKLRVDGLDNRHLVRLRLFAMFLGHSPPRRYSGNRRQSGHESACTESVSTRRLALVNNTIPAIVFIAYQMMFAIITPALITGAFTNRVTFNAYMIFLTGWLLLVYFPFVHMVWGRGHAARMGRKRFCRRHRGA